MAFNEAGRGGQDFKPEMNTKNLQSVEPTELTVEYILQNIEPYKLLSKNGHECVFRDIGFKSGLCCIITCIYTEPATTKQIRMCWKKTPTYNENFLPILLSHGPEKTREITNLALLKYVKEHDIQSL